ncbi:TetR/AcrR family transcriptional regulator C-terminal domain-containing protein [Streptomyces carpaticus]|uniref:TetR/AcrR family transcriptional regulator n=1 Tax=Streptomyces carpaticus TaxID=285558 RepID=UPI00220397AC|nr:TetR/AcrR family transcriptional regulator C-terminal domain-containing protein [Streptomyces carpaticus]
MTTTPQRRPWGSLDRDRIIGAALELARTEGIDALTIRRLATEVGASRMALYRHIPDKETLLELVGNAVAEQELLPRAAGDGPWQHRLTSLAQSMRASLTAYPGLAERIIARPSTGRGGLRLAETLLEILAETGLDEPATATWYLVFLDLVQGRARSESRRGGDPTTPERQAPLLDAAARPGAEAPRLRALAPVLNGIGSDRIFDAEIAMLIRAIEAEAALRPEA